MKKTSLVVLLLTLCGVSVVWAQFAPKAGQPYSLAETTSGLFLDIQTLGINEANAGTVTNNISLSAKPCAIYFEASNGKWIMKNKNGGYVQQATNRIWNVVIGSTPYEWTINELPAGALTIARADGKYIDVDAKVAGQPLFCDKSTAMEFTLQEYETINYKLVIDAPEGK